MDTSTATTHLVLNEDMSVDIDETGLDLSFADGSAYTIDAAETLTLLAALNAHEDQLREHAKTAHTVQRWDDAYRIARDLISQGVQVERLDEDWADSYTRRVVRIMLPDGATVRAHAAGSDIVAENLHAHVRVSCEPVPGVVLHALERREASVEAVA